jgi:hypothetical protein
MFEGVWATGIPRFDRPRTCKVDDGRVGDGLSFRCTQLIRFKAEAREEPEQMGAGVPAFAYGEPVTLEDMVENILIPMAKAIRMGSGECSTDAKDISLTPTIQVNQHNSSIKIGAMHIAMISAGNPVVRYGAEGLSLQRLIPKRLQAAMDNGIRINENHPLDSSWEQVWQEKSKIGGDAGMAIDWEVAYRLKMSPNHRERRKEIMQIR